MTSSGSGLGRLRPRRDGDTWALGSALSVPSSTKKPHHPLSDDSVRATELAARTSRRSPR